MWNLEKWSHLQSRNRDTDAENKWIPRGKDGGWWVELEIGVDTYTLLILGVKQIINENILYSTEKST